MEGLVEGRIVHFVLDNHVFKTNPDEAGNQQSIEGLICRPAIIVNAWGGRLEDGMINIQVFLDGVNDYRLIEREHLHENDIAKSIFKYASKLLDVKSSNLTLSEELNLPFTIWATSVKYSETKEIGTWHWPERG